ncbi:MAG: hypothetical protein AAFP15_17210 [Bacteroidota bacterium]
MWRRRRLHTEARALDLTFGLFLGTADACGLDFDSVLGNAAVDRGCPIRVSTLTLDADRLLALLCPHLGTQAMPYDGRARIAIALADSVFTEAAGEISRAARHADAMWEQAHSARPKPKPGRALRSFRVHLARLPVDQRAALLAMPLGDALTHIEGCAVDAEVQKLEEQLQTA